MSEVVKRKSGSMKFPLDRRILEMLPLSRGRLVLERKMSNCYVIYGTLVKQKIFGLKIKSEKKTHCGFSNVLANISYVCFLMQTIQVNRIVSKKF